MEKKRKIKGKLEKKIKKCQKKKEKEKTLWITVVIHSDLGVGGTVIPPHYLDIVIIDILIQQI
jgi:Flp pilus assembly protein CpaB